MATTPKPPTDEDPDTEMTEEEKEQKEAPLPPARSKPGTPDPRIKKPVDNRVQNPR